MIDLNDLRLEIQTGSTANEINNPSGAQGTWGWDTANANTSIWLTNEPYPKGIADTQGNFNGIYGGEDKLMFRQDDGTVADASRAAMTIYSNEATMAAGKYVGGQVVIETAYFSKNNAYVRAAWQFLNSAGTVLSTSAYTTLTLTGGATSLFKPASTVAPTNTARVRMVIQAFRDSGMVGSPYRYDGIMVSKAMMLINTTSAAVTNQTYIEARTYKNILSPTASININKSELEVGILSAQIYDALLDPNLDPDMKPGRWMRLQAKVSDGWVNVFNGKVTSLKTVYSREGKPQITLSAADAVTVLANTKQAGGVNTIAALPPMLQVTDSPWKVNGSGSGGFGSPVYTYTNDNASLLDQITVTRDSVKGYAWVDRNGVLQVFDANKMPTLDGLMTFTDQPKPASADQITNLALTPKPTASTASVFTISDFSAPAGYNYATAAVATNNDGYIYRSSSDFAGQAIVAFPIASIPSSATHLAVRFKVKATRGVRVTAMYYNGSNYMYQNGTDPGYLDLAAGASGYVNVVLPKGSDGKVYINIQNQGGGNLPANLASAELMRVTEYQVNPVTSASASIPAFFTGDTLYARWSGTINYSSSVYDPTMWVSYTDIDASYDTTDVINHIVIRRLEVNTEGETDEIVYGPYINQTSIDTWGVSKVEIVVAPNVTPSTYASSILTAKANPTIKPGGLTFACISADDFQKAATIDLYTSVDVIRKKDSTYLINNRYRVSSITHNIRPGKWTVAVSFNETGAVASFSGSAPSPPATNTSGVSFYTKTESDARYQQTALPQGVRANLGSKAITTTSYAAVATPNSISITCSKAMKVIVNFSAYMKTTGTGTCDMGAKVVTSGATVVDSYSFGGTNGIIYQWSNGTTSTYAAQHASMTMNLNAGTTTFQIQAYRSAAATVDADLNNLTIEVVPIGWDADYA